MMNVRPRNEQWRNALLSLLEDGVDGPIQQVGTKRPLSCVMSSEEVEPIHSILKLLLAKGENVPRKEERFMRYLQRAFRIEDLELKTKVFRALVQRDDEMHRITIDSIPDHLLSASDVASHVADEYVRNPVNIIPADLTDCQRTATDGAAPEPDDSLAGDAKEKSVDAPKEVQQQKVHHVHRLDMETSGVLMFAKDEHTSAIIDAQFRDREVRQTIEVPSQHSISPYIFYSGFITNCRFRRCTLRGSWGGRSTGHSRCRAPSDPSCASGRTRWWTPWAARPP